MPTDYSKLTPDLITPDHRADVPNTPEGNSFIENLKNSARTFGGNLVSAASHPFDTATSMLDLATGYLNKVGLGTTKGNTPQQEAMVQAMNKHLSDRYGSVEKVKKTAYEDPVGFAADLSTVVAPFAGGAGLAAKGAEAAGLARTASVLGKTAEIGRTVSEVTNPLNAVKGVTRGVAKVAELAGAAPETVNAIAHPASTAAQAIAKRAYAAALNPVGANARRVGQLAQTGLEEGVGPSDEAGLWKKIMERSDQVKGMIDQGTQQGLTLDPAAARANVAAKLLPTAAQGGEAGESFGVQTLPESDQAEVAKGLDEWTRQHFTPATPGVPANPGTIVAGHNTPSPTYVGGTPAIPGTPEQPIPIPIAEGNAIKSGTYQRMTGKDFGQTSAGAPDPIAIAKKQTALELARDLRRQIGDQLEAGNIGDVHGANAAEGRLLDLQPYIEKNAANAARAGLLSKVTKGALIDHILPRVAMGLYKAGKMDAPTLNYILKQSAEGVAVQEQTNGQ